MKTLASRSFMLLMALCLTLSACNLPNRGGTGGSTSATTATPTPETLLPTGFTDILDEKVASGEWTQGQGIVIMLKVFTGEMSAKDAGLGSVQEAEGSGILALAADYLKNGDDPAIKAEITRLVDKILPTRETLDPYTVPASSGKGGDLLGAPDPDTAQECADLWASGFPDTRTPSFKCFIGGEVSVGGNTFRVYFPQAWETDAGKKAFYDATLQAAQDTAPIYSTYGTVKSIYFVFPILADPDTPLSTLAVTYWKSFQPSEEACPVFLYPLSLGLGIGDFKQSVAHEVFHCFQAWNLYNQGIGAGYNSSKWWVEGSAEYFSNVVYPANNYEFRWRANFSYLSATHALTAMDYENFAFLQFIANTEGGPAGVLSLLKSLPTSPGIDAQLQALSGHAGIKDSFEQFARQVFDGQLMDTSGVLITFPSSYTEIHGIIGGQVVPLSGKPFVLDRFKLVFSKERKYSAEVTITGADGHEGARRTGLTGGWEPLPAEIQAGCGDIPYIVYVLTTVPNSSRDYVVNVGDKGEVPCDKCLLGYWVASNSSYADYMASVMAGVPDLVINSVDGKYWLNFDAEGMAYAGYEPLVVSYTQATSNFQGGQLVMDVVMDFEGKGAASYTADGSNLVFSNGAGDVTVNISASMNGNPIPMDSSNMAGPSDPLTSATYSCQGNTLKYYPPIPGVSVSPIIFLRTNP